MVYPHDLLAGKVLGGSRITGVGNRSLLYLFVLGAAIVLCSTPNTLDM